MRRRSQQASDRPRLTQFRVLRLSRDMLLK